MPPEVYGTPSNGLMPAAASPTGDAGVARRSGLVTVLRHPLVVGALLALLSGLFASLLIPSITRSWQDRPKELALKQALVERIGTSTAAALLTLAPDAPQKTQIALYEKTILTWSIEASAIGSQLTTYFANSSLPRQWDSYAHALAEYLTLELTLVAEQQNPGLLRDVVDRLQELPLRDPKAEHQRRKALSTLANRSVIGEDDLSPLVDTFLVERDQFEARIVSSDAAGFSHGFWIFK
jgi:hypothetical protein